MSNSTSPLARHDDPAMIAASAPQGRSLTQDAIRRFRKNHAAMASIYALIFIVMAALIGPYLLIWDFETVDWNAFQAPPDFALGHFAGTDANGRDMLARTLYGTRISLLVALVATLVSITIGIFYGATAGYLGGRIDMAMMRFVDIMYALPYILFVILLMVIFGRNVILLFVGIGMVEWLTMARIVRGQTLSIREREFIEAARAAGTPTGAIIRRHITPNLIGPVVIYAALTVPEIIATESFLSYLGFGVQEPLTSLGTLISEGSAVMESSPWMFFVPATVLVVLLLALLFIGDGLRDAFDPRDH